jgi:integrase/recombinase XerD
MENTSPAIELRYLLNGSEPIVQLIFEYDSLLIRLLKAHTNARWSSSLQCWYIPCNEFYPEKFKRDFGKDYYLHASSAHADTILSNVKGCLTANGKIRPTGLFSKPDHGKEEKMLQFRDWMVSKRYSERTIKVYYDCLQLFFRFFREKPIEAIENRDLVDFNNRYILDNGYSATLQNQVVNALKLFYGRLEGVKLEIKQLERPRRSHPLPNVLSKEEVLRLLRACMNNKHRIMLALIYACGLRRGELLNLKPADIASDRGLLIIRQAKGNKDRVVPISEKTIVMLREYYRMYKPKVWLFEGQVPGQPYGERSLQMVLKHSLELAKIKKPVTLHWLRHSYATHLLENGTDLRYIQELLGHKSSRTTEIYTHVSTQNIQKIKSPFDDLDI